MILTHFPQLEADDVINTSMGAQGVDLKLSPKAKKLLPWAIEVKRRKAFSVVSYVNQHDTDENTQNILFLRQDGRGEKWYVMVEAEYFLKLVPQEK